MFYQTSFPYQHTQKSTMSNSSFLEFQFKLSKSRVLKRPSRMFSRDRQSSGLLMTFQPNSNELRKVFDKFDSNKDGKISPAEYKAILGALGQESKRGDVREIFQVADLDGDGFIDFKEFVEAHKKSGGVRTMDIQSAFRVFDLNGDGKISADEVLQVLRRLGERCTLEECQRMVRAVDADGDGMVNMDEFMTMMTQTMKKC